MDDAAAVGVGGRPSELLDQGGRRARVERAAGEFLGEAAAGDVLQHEVGAAVVLADGVDPPVFRSGNVDGGREVSQRLLDQYWDRIRGW